MPAYDIARIYYGGVGDSIRAFQSANARLSTAPVFQTATVFPYPGGDAQYLFEWLCQRHPVGRREQ